MTSKLPPAARQADSQQKQTRHGFLITPVMHISAFRNKITLITRFSRVFPGATLRIYSTSEWSATYVNLKGY